MRFPCPVCGAERGRPEADCPTCSWKRSPPVTARACPCCGGQDYSWGRVEARNPAQPWSGWLLSFLPGAESAVVALNARKCNGCGNVQLFAEE
jgi:hypothetical protein